MTTCWRLKRTPSPAATTTASPERMTSGAMPPTGPDHPISTATRVPAKAGTTAKKYTNWRANGSTEPRTMTGAGSCRGHGHPATKATRTRRPAWAARINPHCRSHADEIAENSVGRAQPREHRHQALAGIGYPDQVRPHDQAGHSGGDQRVVGTERSARALVDQREQQEQSDQDQPDISGEQQQPDLDRERKPIRAPPLAHRPPIMQEDNRPERHREDDRSEVGRRHREGRNADHEQHRKRRMLRTDDRTSEHEYRPVGDDHADLREHVDGEQAAAAEIVDQLGEPEGERRTEISTELELVSDRDHARQVARRPGIEQARNQRPQQRLCNRGQPNRKRRTRSQQFHEDRDVKHRPQVTREHRPR